MNINKKWILYAVIIIAIWFIGYMTGKLSVSGEERQETTEEVDYKTSPVIVRDTVYFPEPYLAFYRDTVTKYVTKLEKVDTVAILKDYYLTRVYSLDFSNDTIGKFVVDAEVSENKLLRANSNIQPIYKVVTKTTTITKEKIPALQIYGMIGISPKLDFTKVSIGVDLKQKFLIGVSGLRWDNNKYNYSVDLGIKF